MRFAVSAPQLIVRNGLSRRPERLDLLDGPSHLAVWQEQEGGIPVQGGDLTRGRLWCGCPAASVSGLDREDVHQVTEPSQVEGPVQVFEDAKAQER